MRSLLALSAFALLGFIVAPGTAGAADTFVLNDPCDQLGATHMSADRTGLVVCALNTGNTTDPNITCATGGGCTWKAMSVTAQGMYPGFPDIVKCVRENGIELYTAGKMCQVVGNNCYAGTSQIVYYDGDDTWVAFNTADGSFNSCDRSDTGCRTDCAQSALSLDWLKNQNRTFYVYTK